jgi:malonyl-CoA O-methyltransferase
MHSGPINVDVASIPFSPAPDCAAHHAWPWRKRIVSAARRRLKAWRSVPRNCPHPIDAAAAWFNRQAGRIGLADRPDAPACPGITAATLPSLANFGQLDLAQRFSAWLLATQRADGSFPQAGADVGSLFNTAQALLALLELEETELAVPPDAARRAAAYLNMRLEVEPPHADLCRPSPSVIRIAVVPPLVTAARRFEAPHWRRTAENVIARARNAVDWHAWTGSSRLFAQAAEAWVALGEVELARETMTWPAGRQRKNGAVAGDSRGAWGDNGLVAHLAALWYRLGEREPADRAMGFLETQQLADGGWNQYWGRGAKAGESAWVAKYYLDAAWLRSTSSFNHVTYELPQTIDVGDGRFTAVRDWFRSLGGMPKVADVGCGPGRFLRELAPEFPGARLVGIDPSAALLGRIPASVEARRGDFLRIPAGDGEFDGAFAVESLEHSLLPEQAVSELCRVVRPGGRVLIIDKHVARQALSLHEPWERWFLPETVAAWLARYCHDVRVRPISHGTGQGDDLFLCWEARKAA